MQTTIDLFFPPAISRRLDIPYFVMNKHGKILDANKAFANKVGYNSVQSLLASPERVFADEHSRVLWMRSHAKKQYRQGYRLCFNPKKTNLQRPAVGTTTVGRLPLWMRCRSWKHKSGRDFVLECLLEDVSNEVEAEGAYQRLFEGLPVPCHEIGPRGALTFVNKAELDLLGYKPEEADVLLGKPVWQRLIPQDRTESKRVVQKKMSGACEVGGEPIYRNYRHKDGTSIPVRIEDKFNPEPTGQRTRIVSTLTDLRLPQDLVLVLQRKNIVTSPMLAGLPIYAFSKNHEHSVMAANQRLTHEWEQSGKEVVWGYTTDFDLFRRDLAQIYVMDDRTVMRKRRALQKIERHRFAGEKTPCLVQVVKLPRMNASGKVVGIQGFFWRVDDSEHVKRELARWFSERVDEAFDEAFNRLPSAAFRVGTEGQLFYANDALGRLLGYPDGESLVSRWETENWANRIKDPDLRRQFQEKMSSKEQRVEDFHYPMIQANGAAVWVSESSSVVAAGDDSMKFIEGFIHDIDGVKRSEQRYWNLFNNTQDVIYSHTVREPFQFTSINPSGTRLSGYEAEEFLKLRLEDLIHPESIMQVRREFQMKITDPEQLRKPYEAKILTKQKKTRVILIHSFVRKDNFGAVEEIVGVCQDITEGSRIRNELVESMNKQNALQDFIREQGKIESAANMIQVVTHYLVALHQTIRQDGRIIQDYIQKTKGVQINIDQVNAALSNMTTAVDRSVKNLRKLKTVQAVRQASISECRVSDVVQRSWEMVKPTAPDSITFVVDCDPEIDLARLDEEWLQNCLVCIFENSLYELAEMKKLSQQNEAQTMPEGKICLKTTRGRNELGNNCLVIEISDSGRGVNDHTLEKMFDPCFTTKPNGEGLGLGLAEVKKCVTAHGGEIQACIGESGGLKIIMKFLNIHYETTSAAD